MSMAEWYGVEAPKGKLEPMIPSAGIVQSACLDHVPGARLTADLRGVMDSRGWVTHFFLVDGYSIYGRVTAPDGSVSWVRSTRRVVDY